MIETRGGVMADALDMMRSLVREDPVGKVCKRCSQFFPPRGGRQGRPNPAYADYCLGCLKSYALRAKLNGTTEKYLSKARFLSMKQKYDVDETYFRDMYNTQNGQCCACGEAFPPINLRTKKIMIDHDHKTGVVRGLLCMKCNSVLGLVDDNASKLAKLIGYLARSDNRSARMCLASSTELVKLSSYLEMSAR
jgi:Recombination endonuclease VII